MTATRLPLPSLAPGELGGIPLVTDDALARQTGVRVVFTGRAGGVSEGPWAALNLGSHVDDDPAAVAENRRRVAAALGIDPSALIVPSQVHGTQLVSVDASDAASVARAADRAAAGADGIVVGAPGVAALLCFADCVPVIVVSPSGRFAVVHAGWRGVAASIAPKAVAALVEADRAVLGADAPTTADLNVYVGPHIRSCCFACGDDVRSQFADAFGEGCVAGGNVDLAAALAVDLGRAGVDAARIADAGRCTRCHPDEFFSYRASGGVCGRHGAVACRLER